MRTKIWEVLFLGGFIQSLKIFLERLLVLHLSNKHLLVATRLPHKIAETSDKYVLVVRDFKCIYGPLQVIWSQ